jgi:hypothetical protein
MTARRIVLALVTIVGLGTMGSAAGPVPITGRVNADAGIFIPVKQQDCRITFFHPGHHDLTGSLAGTIVEEGTLVLDKCTGDGFYNVTAAFTGTVLGSAPGTATFTAHGSLHSFNRIDRGHFTLSRGAGGLAGVHAVGTFEFTIGLGGDYAGVAHIDQRSK